MSMPNIDWNQVWRDYQSLKEQNRFRDSSFWDGRAEEFTRAVSKTDYVKQFIDILRPEPGWRVLDIGAAAGTLAVPLASRVRHVTALEPSARMRELLVERCRKEGLSNISIVAGRWQDDWGALGIGPYDVAIASRSLIVEDLREAVDKLNRFATSRVAISTMVGEGPHDSRIIEAVGRRAQESADFIVVYNLLRQMGIFANVAFTRNSEEKSWADLDEAVAGMRWMLHAMTAEEEIRLRGHLAKTLIRQNGRLTLPYRKVVRWAVLWWDKDAVSIG